MIKAVVFDYGGTLVTELEPWSEVRPRAVRSAYGYLRSHGLRASLEEYIAINRGVFERFAEREEIEHRDIPDTSKYIELVGELIPGATKARRRALALGANNTFWKVANSNFRLRGEAKRCLDDLESMELGLGLISNHHDGSALMRSLRPYRITQKFDPIVISEKVGMRKPDPAIFMLCLSAMRVSPRQAVYVGDVPEFDVAGAKAAGMYSILIGDKGRDGPKPDFAVKGMEEIPPIVARLNGGMKDDKPAARRRRQRSARS
jgi:putative hydrolase of the HAD superfamily